MAARGREDRGIRHLDDYPPVPPALSPTAEQAHAVSCRGVGVGFTEYNDTTPSGEGFHVNTTYASVVGSRGAGLEYFVIHNIALWVETKYVFFRDVELRVDGPGAKRIWIKSSCPVDCASSSPDPTSAGNPHGRDRPMRRTPISIS
jgi:hypothetical protein